MAEFYAGGIVYEIRVDDKSGIGIKQAEGNLKGFENKTKDTDIKIKSLTKDSAVLGSSFQALGGSAMVAGTAIGGPLGESLQSSGMGLAFLGSGLATVVPAMRGLSVMVDGTLIPALIRLNAFLGPTGWIVIGIAAATAAIGAFIYMQDRAKDSVKGYSLSAEDAKKNVEGLTDAMRERARLEKELAGIPVKEEELKFELAGAKLDERAAYARVQKMYEEGVTGIELEQAGYSFLMAERRRKRIEEQISGLGEIEPALRTATTTESQYQAAVALGVPFEQTKQFQFMAGTGQPETRKGDLVININGTITDQSFKIPGNTLKDQTSAQGYTG
jgi:hypothetical protein